MSGTGCRRIKLRRCCHEFGWHSDISRPGRDPWFAMEPASHEESALAVRCLDNLGSRHGGMLLKHHDV